MSNNLLPVVILRFFYQSTRSPVDDVHPSISTFYKGHIFDYNPELYNPSLVYFRSSSYETHILSQTVQVLRLSSDYTDLIYVMFLQVRLVKILPLLKHQESLILYSYFIYRRPFYLQSTVSNLLVLNPKVYTSSRSTTGSSPTLELLGVDLTSVTLSIVFTPSVPYNFCPQFTYLQFT